MHGWVCLRPAQRVAGTGTPPRSAMACMDSPCRVQGADALMLSGGPSEPERAMCTTSAQRLSAWSRRDSWPPAGGAGAGVRRPRERLLRRGLRGDRGRGGARPRGTPRTWQAPETRSPFSRTTQRCERRCATAGCLRKNRGTQTPCVFVVVAWYGTRSSWSSCSGGWRPRRLCGSRTALPRRRRLPERRSMNTVRVPRVTATPGRAPPAPPSKRPA